MSANILEIDLTGGEWIVTETQAAIPGHLTIRRADNGEPIAVVPPNGNIPNWGDAAIMCAAKDALNAIIELHELICFSKGSFSVERVDEIVSRFAEKVNAEYVTPS